MRVVGRWYHAIVIEKPPARPRIPGWPSADQVLRASQWTAHLRVLAAVRLASHLWNRQLRHADMVIVVGGHLRIPRVGNWPNAYLVVFEGYHMGFTGHGPHPRPASALTIIVVAVNARTQQATLLMSTGP
jgi:hypothetical protein